MQAKSGRDPQPPDSVTWMLTGHFRPYDLMPDGERFVMMMPVAEGEGEQVERQRINVVQNWLQELRDAVPVP